MFLLFLICTSAKKVLRVIVSTHLFAYLSVLHQHVGTQEWTGIECFFAY